MKNIYKYLWLLLISIGFVACEVDEIETSLPPEAEFPALNAGSLDFSKYVSVGASFTAGFTDNALFIAAQENSFPNILAQQFAQANGGSFSQPLMNDNVGGLLFGGSPMADGSFGPRLFFNGAGPATLPGTPTTDAATVLSGPFNNVGVPGAKSFHVTFDGYGTLNPYFGRMASSAGASMLGDALAQSPTFFTLSEIGGNDVLGYATSGGTGVDQTGNFDPTQYGNNDITDPNVFAQVFSGMVTALTGSGAKGIVTNVPYITDLAHFTTVPYAPLDPSNETFGPLIPTLNTVYGALNNVYAFLQFQGAITDAAARTITFSTSAASAVVIKDEDLADLSAQIAGVLSASPDFAGLLASFGLPTDAGTVGAVAALFGATFGQTRQATAEDLLVLPSSSIIGTVNADVFAFLQSQGLPAAVAGQFSVEGITLPLEDKWVLIPSEQTAIKNATDAYNTTIEGVASANPNVALADFKGLLAEASTSGISFQEFTMTTDLVFGGLISLDGVHLTARGYAFMAAVFLDVLDENFGSNFIDANVFPKALDYNTIYSPSLP